MRFNRVNVTYSHTSASCKCGLRARLPVSRRTLTVRAASPLGETLLKVYEMPLRRLEQYRKCSTPLYCQSFTYPQKVTQSVYYWVEPHTHQLSRFSKRWPAFSALPSSIIVMEILEKRPKQTGTTKTDIIREYIRSLDVLSSSTRHGSTIHLQILLTYRWEASCCFS